MEVGAGTGYWAATLRRRGVDVLAYDLNPPGAEAPEANAYHGHLPPFTDVLRGGPKARTAGNHTTLSCSNLMSSDSNPLWGCMEDDSNACCVAKLLFHDPDAGSSRAQAAAEKGRALFLCYPPPADPMAVNCLRRFRCGVRSQPAAHTMHVA